MSIGRGERHAVVDGRTLFRHDWLAACNAARFTFARWHDRAIAATLALAIVGAIRSMLLRAPSPLTVVLVVAGMIGIGAGRLVASRLAFHASDGALAAAALHPASRRRFAARWHAIGVALVATVSTMAYPASVPAAMAGYGVGIAVGALGSTGRWRWTAIDGRAGWTLRRWARGWRAGAAVGGAMLVLLLAVRLDGSAVPVPLAVGATLMGALLLTPVDHTVVTFMGSAGHGTASMIRHHTGSLPVFATVALTASAVMAGRIAAALAAATVAATLLLLALRLLCYRLHGRRTADLLVGVFVGLLVAVAYAMPPGLPLIAGAMLWSLHRRAQGRRWLLA